MVSHERYGVSNHQQLFNQQIVQANNEESTAHGNVSTTKRHHDTKTSNTRKNNSVKVYKPTGTYTLAVEQLTYYGKTQNQTQKPFSVTLWGAISGR